jgi:hypothetical protein
MMMMMMMMMIAEIGPIEHLHHQLLLHTQDPQQSFARDLIQRIHRNRFDEALFDAQIHRA